MRRYEKRYDILYKGTKRQFEDLPLNLVLTIVVDLLCKKFNQHLTLVTQKNMERFILRGEELNLLSKLTIILAPKSYLRDAPEEGCPETSGPCKCDLTKKGKNYI